MADERRMLAESRLCAGKTMLAECPQPRQITVEAWEGIRCPRLSAAGVMFMLLHGPLGFTGGSVDGAEL